MENNLRFTKEKETYLLKCLSEGDEDSFVQFFQTYKAKLYSFLLAITRSEEIAEDIVQDVFLKIWQNRAKAQNIENFNAWIYQVAKNSAIDQMKRATREICAIGEITQYTGSSLADNPLERLKGAEMQERIRNAVAKLPKQQRMVYQLHREQGYKHEEIARKMSLSVSTIRSHLTNALVFLKKSLMFMFFLWFTTRN